uniref:CRM domain-containing protein n=1 Tax=Eucampia antarctica TaxID=49252 RepID=A0A7S2R0N8_9STRA
MMKHGMLMIEISLVFSLLLCTVSSFQIGLSSHNINNRASLLCTYKEYRTVKGNNRATTVMLNLKDELVADDDDDELVVAEEDDDEVEEEEEEEVVLEGVEKAWRYAKKPLVRLGNKKGATAAHGNSLRQLLEDHTVVKVKINTGKLGSLQEAFEILKTLAQQSSATTNDVEEYELIHVRPSENTILVGLPGTLAKIQSGDFPPPPPPPYVPRQRPTDDDEE